MAYDPQARKQSNSALIIGLITLLVVGGAALAYFATRTPETPETSAVIMTREKETIIQATPLPQTNTIIIREQAPATPDTVVVTPPANTNTTRNADPAPRAPVAAPPADEPKATVNNTIINPPAPNGSAKPVKPDAAPADATPADNSEITGY